MSSHARPEPGSPTVAAAPQSPAPVPGLPTARTTARAARPLGRWLALVAVVALLPYLDTLAATFTFDDFGLVLQNPKAVPGMSPLAWFLRESTTGSLYRPVTMATYAVNQMLGSAPWGFHLGNVLLHVLATIAAFDLARLLLRSTPGALATALVFAVHPVHTEAVASVAGRAEILAALFVMLALSAFVRARRDPGRFIVWTLASLLAFAAGALSKESAFVTLPLVALVAVWIEPPRAGRLAGSLLPYVLVGAACLGLRRAVVGSFGLLEPPPFVDNPLAYTVVASRLATALVVIFEYLSVLALPLRLSADESFNQVPVVTSAFDVRLLAAASLLALVAAGLIVQRRRLPVLGLAALFFLGAMAVTANVLFPIGTIKAERLLYLPSFGWCLACGWLIRRWTGRTWSYRMAAVALGLALLAGRTWARNADWHDDYTLFTRTAAMSPASARAHANAAAVYGQAGRLDLAAQHFREAWAIHPEFAPAAMGLGQIAGLKGEQDDALRWYREAMRVDPHLTQAYVRAGDLLLRRGDAAGAEALLRSGLAQAPNDPQLLAGLAAARLAQGTP